MSINQFYTRDVDTVAAMESVQTAAHRMHARNVGTLVILDKKRTPIGILTDRDVVLRVVGTGKDPSRTTVEEVMTKHLTTVPEDASIKTAVAAMHLTPCRRLPVVDHNGQLVGLLSLDDVLSMIGEEFTEIGELLVREKPVRGIQF